MIQNATLIALEMCLDGIALEEIQQILHHVFLFAETKFKLLTRLAMMEIQQVATGAIPHAFLKGQILVLLPLHCVIIVEMEFMKVQIVRLAMMETLDLETDVIQAVL